VLALKRKVLWVVAVAVSVTVLAAVLVWSVLTPQLAPGSREVRLTMVEFGFNGEQGGPIVYVGVGETLKFVLENRGKGKHQFMIVKDLEGLRKELRSILEGSVDGGSEQLENRLETLRQKYAAVELYDQSQRYKFYNVRLDPGEVQMLVVVFREPGIYYYVCTELVLTSRESHVEKGMYGTVFVTPEVQRFY
jgi:uncharacterized cupredoxin-like copper-binding protein